MFKKTLALLAATVTLTVGMGTVALAANCADGAHNWSKISETAATCTTAGSATYVCATNGCNASKTEEIPAKGHSKVLVNTTESTCKDQGVATYECKVCFDVTTEKLPLAAHTWAESDAKAPTCTEPGVTAGKVCKVCGKTEANPETVPAAGHTWGEWKEIVAPSCTMNGWEERFCTVCGKKDGRDIATSGHNYVVVPGKAATCTADGKSDSTVCSVCGDIKVAATRIPALNHDYVITTVIEPQACWQNGKAVYTCTRCGNAIRDIIPADHVSHNVVIAFNDAATCKDWGHFKTVCSICDTVIEEKWIEPLDHQYKPVTKQELSCTQDGHVSYQCMYCNGWKVNDQGYAIVDVVPKIDHKYAVEQKAVAPTCTTEGTDGYWYCPDCKKYAYFAGGGFVNDVPNTTKATGHTLKDKKGNEKYTVVDATCVSPKKIVYHCLNKGCLYTEVVVDDKNGPDKTAHKYVNVPAKDPTCTEPGYKAYEKCSLCDKPNGKIPTIPALNHDWTVVAGKAATCTEAGYSEAHKCTRCDAKVGGQTVPALGHRYVVDEKLSSATITVEVCSVCKDIKYTEHDGSCKHNWVVLKGTPATCTSAGVSDGKKCTICGEVQGYEKLPRLEHKPYYVPAVAPTCTKDGHSALYACEYCYKALTEYDVYMSNGEHTPVYGYDNDVHYMACKTCGEILLSGAHELVTTVSGGKVHTACKWCAYSKESSIFGK